MAQLNSLLVTGNSRFLNPINGNARNGVYYVKGTQTAATGAWTGVIPVPALYDGLTIMYYLPYAGSGNATLNLTLSDGTTTGAINCYYHSGRLTTHYSAGSNIVMTYHPAGSISVSGTATTDNRWIANANYADGNDNAYNVRDYYNRFVAGANSIFPYTIIMQLSDGKWESIVTSSSTGTSKSRNSHGFRFGQIALYYNNGNTCSSGAVVNDSNIFNAYTSGLVDHRYSFNTANDSTNGTTANKPVYLVGSISSSDGLFYLDSSKWWTQTLPSSADGKIYIYLGDAYDYYRMTFTIHNPAYVYTNGKIREYSQDSGTVNGHTVDKDVPSNAVFTDNNTTYSMTRDGANVKLTPSSGSAQSVGLSDLINGLGEGTSAAQQDDYLVAQYAGGGTTTTSYHRRAVKNIVNAANVKTALGTGSGTTKYLREDGTWQTPPSGSDVNVTQTETTTNANYEFLLSGTADNQTRTEGARKSSTLIYNPAISRLQMISNDAGIGIRNGNGTLVGSFVQNEFYLSSDDGRDNTIILEGSTGSITANSLNGVTIGSSPKFTDNNTTYTFANGTNGFTVTPSGGSAQTVTVTPSITNNVTGSGTSGYIAKFNGANTITNGPAFGSSTSTYLRNDGNWASQVWEGTQAQYDALSTHDPNITYFITDGTPIGQTLDELSDVTITGPSADDNLFYSNGIWVNGSPTVQQVNFPAHEPGTPPYNSNKYNLLFANSVDSSATEIGPVNKAEDLAFMPYHFLGPALRIGATAKGVLICGQVNCVSISIQDVSSQYTFTKSSGGWQVSDIKATRSGNVVHLTISLQGTGTNVSAGGNGVVGTLSGGPLPAQDHAGLVGYYGTSAMVANLTSAGNLTVRNLISAQTLGSNTTSVYGCFVCS